jgi:hypothetical protein
VPSFAPATNLTNTTEVCRNRSTWKNICAECYLYESRGIGWGVGRDNFYIEKKGLIERELEKCAKASPMEYPSYAELGRRVRIPTQGPGNLFLTQSPTKLMRKNGPIRFSVDGC